jgi:hypothetical protein
MMTYPNGCITLGHLKEMIGNPDFIVYAERLNQLLRIGIGRLRAFIEAQETE